MKLDLLIKEISDPIAKENFHRLKRELEAQQILAGFWQFYEVELPAAGDSIPIKHNLSFVPQDVLILSLAGDQNTYFDTQKFDKNNVYITTSAPTRVRFLLGRYGDKQYGGSKKDFELIPPAFIGIGGNGNAWFSDSGAPLNSLGVVGSFYLDTVNKYIYLKIGESTWAIQGKLKSIPQQSVILAGSTATIHVLPLSEFVSMEYLINIRDAGATKSKSFKMQVDNGATGLHDTIFSILGDNLSYTISASIVGSNMELVVTNNEVFDIVTKFDFNKF